MPRPYEQTFVYDRYVTPELAFFATLPAFSAIGKQFQAIWRAHLRCDDPSRPWRELVAKQPDEPFEVPAAGESDHHSGRYRVECCRAQPVTEHQKRLFDWLEANQNSVVEMVKPGIAHLFDDTIQWRSSPDLREQILFPSDATDDEKLDRFQVKHFKLEPKGQLLWIELESMDAWFDEHGCCVVLKDEKLWCAGSWDDVHAAHEQSGPDFKYFA
jgi:hypothetical protein